jgi:hypothetical protein
MWNLRPAIVCGASSCHIALMPIPNLTAEECKALAALVRKTIRESRFPYDPDLKPLKTALRKLDPTSARPNRRVELLPLRPGRWWVASGSRGKGDAGTTVEGAPHSLLATAMFRQDS